MVTNPSLFVRVGRAVKKTIRQYQRGLKYGTAPFVKSITLPETQFTIVIHPTKNACVDETIANTGVWETAITRQIARHLPLGGTCIDIGANIGYHTLFAAALLQNSGQVYAFEPVTTLRQQLEQSVENNRFSNVRVYPYGLGDTTTTAPIFLRDENMGGSSLFQHENLDIVRVSDYETIEIKTLDEIIPAATPVNLIKIDIEGFELEALTGGRKLLETARPVIIFEFSPVFYDQSDTNKANSLVTFLTELGYQFYTLDDTPLDLYAWLKQSNRSGQIDILAINSTAKRSTQRVQ